MKTLSEIKKRTALRKIKLQEALSVIIQQLKQMGAIKIVLFGSLVSDKVSLGSDLDILVIMPKSQPGKYWLKKIYTEIARKVACDFFVFNEDEYKAEKAKNFFLKGINKKGKVVYEKRI